MLVGRIANGGYGTVFAGRCGERDVAVKLQLPSDNNPLAAIMQEAVTNAGLEHANVCTLLGRTARNPTTGELGLVMERCRTSLADLMQDKPGRPSCLRGPRGWERKLKAVRHTAAGLAYLHASGWVHNDLKPANLLVGYDKAIKIADFGCARQSALCGGTYNYMSPEAALSDEPAAGTSMELAGRSDVYSFGCVMFELACGQRPWAGHHPYAILSALYAGNVPQLDLADERLQLPCAEADRCGHAAACAFVALTNRCLAADPAGRPSAAEARDTLAARNTV